MFHPRYQGRREKSLKVETHPQNLYYVIIHCKEYKTSQH
jgi:hypothetical protein